ncbi:hypothetical protein CARUB_v10012087mg, partial [Capsella rubella]
PLDSPHMAKMLIVTPQFNCSNEIISVSSLVSARPHLERNGHYLTAKDNQVVHLHPSNFLDHKPWRVSSFHISS